MGFRARSGSVSETKDPSYIPEFCRLTKYPLRECQHRLLEPGTSLHGDNRPGQRADCHDIALQSCQLHHDRLQASVRSEPY